MKPNRRPPQARPLLQGRDWHITRADLPDFLFTGLALGGLGWIGAVLVEALR